MKKIIALVLALAMVLSFAACTKKEEPAPAPAPETNTTPEVTPVAPTEDEKKEIPEEEHVAYILHQQFLNMMKEKPDATAEEIATALIENEIIIFMGGAMEVEAGYLAGFSKDMDGFKQAFTFCPMISSIPFVGYIFELEDEKDAPDFMKTLDENADMRWNICTEADDKKIDSVGNKVFFLMAPAAFEE